MCQPYNCAPVTKRFHEATDSTAVIQCGSEVKSLPQQLGSIDNRQVGSRLCTGISNPLHKFTGPTTPAKPSYILCRAKLADSRGSEHTIRKGSNYPNKTSLRPPGLLLDPLPCPQERGSDEASHQSQEVERMGNAPALQNGGHGDAQGTTEDERLDGEGRPQRCLLHNSNTQRPSALPEIYGRAKSLSVHMSTIWSVMCTMGIHQSDEAGCNISSCHGGANDSLHRRHFVDGRHSSSGEESPRGSDATADRFGVYCQRSEICHHPNPADRVPGSEGGLYIPSFESTRGETPSHKDGGQPASAEVTGDGTTISSTDRQASCSISGSSACPPILPVTTGRPTEGSESGQSELQYDTFVVTSRQRGANMVAGEACSLEWQSSTVQTANYGHNLRCLSPGLGGSVQGDKDWGSMGPPRAGNAHKLPRTAGSNPSSENIPEGSHRDDSVVTAGQPNSCCLHKQYGGHGISPTDRSSQNSVDVGFGQRHHSDCRVHTRGSECGGRRRVQVNARQDGLEASPQVVPADQPEVGTTAGRSFRISSVHPTTSLFQLETRPTGRGNRCLQPAMGDIQGLCEPSMVFDRQSAVSGATATSSSHSGGPSVEGAAVVSHAVGNAVQLPTATTSHFECSPADIQCQSNGPSAPTSRVAYLRQKFGGGGLSEAAKELILASWRSKTSKAYDSHFKKWLGWCTERGLDPVSGPISNVANFLADLHAQGYQTNSLNAYRSAISSVHDKVDDMDVGKHPLVSRVLKGAFHARPPLPRYTTTWNVQVVLDCISQWGDTRSLSLKLLTYKLVMLMALTRPSRSADLASLTISKCQFKPEGVSFLPSNLAKQSRQGKPLADIFFATFPGNKELCPVETLRHYQTVTSPLRKESTQLFVATVKPHKPVASCTIARWLKEVLKLSGIDVNIFTAHSTRSASVSAAADSGVTTNDILKAADWSTESVFRKFYYRPTQDPSYGRAVLSSTSGET